MSNFLGGLFSSDLAAQVDRFFCLVAKEREIVTHRLPGPRGAFWFTTIYWTSGWGTQTTPVFYAQLAPSSNSLLCWYGCAMLCAIQGCLSSVLKVCFAFANGVQLGLKELDG